MQNRVLVHGEIAIGKFFLNQGIWLPAAAAAIAGPLAAFSSISATVAESIPAPQFTITPRVQISVTGQLDTD